METIGPEDAAWLASGEAGAWLGIAADEEVTPRLVSRLRADLSASRVAAVLEVAEARRRGAAKFSRASQMLLTRRGLQQATDEWIAAYKAERFRRAGSIIDIGCGVGGDLCGIGSVNTTVRAVERNPALAVFAGHNSAVYGAAVEVSADEAGESDLAGCDAWHVDPDRRPAEKRTVRPEASEPSLETLQRWRALNPNSAIKLAPAATLDTNWQAECELEWISRGGECRQLVAWGGELAERSGQRCATRVIGGPAAAENGVLTFTGEVDLVAARSPVVRDWFYEPDPAVLAAGLTGALATDCGLEQFGEVGYLTGERPVSQALLTPFRVVETLPYDRRRLKGWLSERGVGRLEVKVRGVAAGPAALERELKSPGDHASGDKAMVLLLAPTPADPRKPIVVAAERVS